MAEEKREGNRGGDVRLVPGSGEPGGKGVSPGPDGHIIFLGAGGEEMLRLGTDGAWVRGEQVDDNRAVYDEFCRWLATCRIEPTEPPDAAITGPKTATG